MHTIYPTSQPGVPLALLRVLLVALIVTAIVLFKFQRDRILSDVTVREFESDRTAILDRINQAATDDNLDALLKIDSRYSACVKDQGFQSALRDALAKTWAREAETELTVARNLDLARHSEESSLRPNRFKPQVSLDRDLGAQRLSALPH